MQFSKRAQCSAMFSSYDRKIQGVYRFLTDLSKAFDCIDHKLLIAKLYWYEISLSSINLLSSYLSNGTQRIKINDCFSLRHKIEYAVPQGSILRPLVFSIDLIDLFFICENDDIASYAGDTTPYTCTRDTPTVISELQSTSEKLFNWFEKNHLKANPEKCHLSLSSKFSIETKIGSVSVKSRQMETLLGVLIDSEVNFKSHISNICSKVSKKLNALGRIAGYITFEKRRMLFKAFIESQFNYRPLIWMLHSRTMNDKINRLHERSLKIVYSDQSSTFEELLERDKTFSIHHKNIQSLAIEIYKFLNGLSPEIMNSMFNLNENNQYSLRNVFELYSHNPRTVKYGKETISYLAPKIWSQTIKDHKPQTIKEGTSIHSFKTKISKWKPNCPCWLCKRCLQHVGFV